MAPLFGGWAEGEADGAVGGMELEFAVLDFGGFDGREGNLYGFGAVSGTEDEFRGFEEGFAGLWLAREFSVAKRLVTHLLLPSPWFFVSIDSKGRLKWFVLIEFCKCSF